MELRALRPEEMECWLDFVATNMGQTRAELVERLQMEPHNAIDTVRVAAVDGQIIASLRIVLRNIYLAGLIVPVGGLADLCTGEGYRGRGVAGALLMDAIREMARRDIPLSLIFPPRQDLFARLGWRPVPIEFWRARLPVEDPGHPCPDGVQVAVAHPRDPSEARQLQAIHASFARPYQGAVVRSDIAYWQLWVPQQWKQAVLARRDGRVVGYLAARWSGDGELTVEDFAARPGEEATTFRTLCSAMARKRSLSSVEVRYPAALPVGLSPEGRELLSGPMYRVATPRVLPLESAQVLDSMMQGEVGRHLIFPADWF